MEVRPNGSSSSNATSSLSSYYSYHHDHPSNLTVVTTVRIRVTPLHDHPISWGILFLGFVIASVVATLQVVKENRILKNPSSRSNDDALERGDTEVPLYSSADVTRSLVCRDMRDVCLYS